MTAASSRACRSATLLVVALSLAGCGSGHVAAPVRARADAVAQALIRDGAVGSIVYISDRGHSYVTTAGTPRPSNEASYPIGSVTKTFTATIVLQLVAERKISLDATLGHYLPGAVRYGKRITVRELLQHRSGLADFTDALFQQRLQRPATTPSDSLKAAGSVPLWFAPGTQWIYSNTNYIALGLIIEKVTGHTYSQELTARILKPLGLNHTTLATARHPASPMLPWASTPSLAWAAGAIVSNGDDLGRFFSALLSGRLLPPALLAEMERTVPTGASSIPLGATRDGLGLFADSPCGRFWGHDGVFPPYRALVRASMPRKRIVVILARMGGETFDPPPTNVQPLLCK